MNALRVGDRVNWRTTNGKGNPCSKLSSVYFAPRGGMATIFVYGIAKLRRVPLSVLRRVKPNNTAQQRAANDALCSPVGRVKWQAANLYPTNGGASVDAWILSVNGRPILHAVALSEITEPVSADDRKMIGQALAEYLANNTDHAQNCLDIPADEQKQTKP